MILGSVVAVAGVAAVARVTEGGGDGSRIRVGRAVLATPPPVRGATVVVEYSRAISVSHVSGDHRRDHARAISGDPGVTYRGKESSVVVGHGARWVPMNWSTGMGVAQ